MLELSELDEVIETDEESDDNKNNEEPKWYTRGGDRAGKNDEKLWETSWWSTQGDDSSGYDEHNENKKETNDPPRRYITKNKTSKGEELEDMVRELEKGLIIGPEVTNEGPNETLNIIEEGDESQHRRREEKDKEMRRKEK